MRPQFDMVPTRKKHRHKSPINRRSRASAKSPLPLIKSSKYNSYRPERTRTLQSWDTPSNEWGIGESPSNGVSHSEIYLKKKTRNGGRKSAFSNSDMRLNFAKKKKRKKRSSDFNYLRSKYVSLNKRDWDRDPLAKTQGMEWREKPLKSPVMRNSLVIGKKPKMKNKNFDMDTRLYQKKHGNHHRVKRVSNLLEYQRISDSLREMTLGPEPEQRHKDGGWLYHHKSDARFGKLVNPSKTQKHKGKALMDQFKKSKPKNAALYNNKSYLNHTSKFKKMPKINTVMRSMDMGKMRGQAIPAPAPARRRHFPSQRMTTDPNARKKMAQYLKRKNSYHFETEKLGDHMKFSRTVNNSQNGRGVNEAMINIKFPNTKKRFDRFSNLKSNRLSNSMNRDIDQINYQKMKEQIDHTFKNSKNQRNKLSQGTVKKRMPVAELIRQTPKTNVKNFPNQVENNMPNSNKLEGSANSYRVLDTPKPGEDKQSAKIAASKIKTYSALEPSKIEVKPKVKKPKVKKGPNFSIKFANVDGLDKGKTKVGQDSVLVQKFEFQKKQFYLFGIFDGHGRHGHHCSQFLKKNFGSCLKQLMVENHSQHVCIETLITDTVKILHRRIDEIQAQTTAYHVAASKDKNFPKMVPTSDLFDASLSGSTCALILMFEDQIFSVSLGDSRGILGFMDKMKLKPCQISREHKTSDQKEKIRVLQFGGLVRPVMDMHGQVVGPDRVWDSSLKYPGLLVTRSFGDLVGKACGVSGVPGMITVSRYNDHSYIKIYKALSLI